MKSLIALRIISEIIELMKKGIILTLSILFSFPVFANLNEFIEKHWRLNSTQKEHLKEGKILSEATVESDDINQHFFLQGMAMHKRDCTRVLRKLSVLENYKDWISFIKRSDYNEESRLLTLKADHVLLPYPMIVFIVVDRPSKPGLYPFVFPTGLFKDLAGFFEIKEIGGRCVVYTESKWSGPKTNIPNIVVEMFSEALSKKGAEILMRKSR